MPIQIAPLAPETLRWRVDEKSLLRSASEATGAMPSHGQPIAQEALRYALLAGNDFHQHIFIRGPAGSGRRALLQAMHTALQPPHRARLDYCYACRFAAPARPQLLALPPGSGPAVGAALAQLADFIGEHLPRLLDGAPLKARRDALRERTVKAINELTRPLEEELKVHGLALVRVRDGSTAQMAVFPTVVGKPVPPEEFQQLVESGQVERREWERYQAALAAVHERSAAVADQVMQLWRDGQKALAVFDHEHIQRLLHEMTGAQDEVLHIPACRDFIAAVTDDVIAHFPAIKAGGIDPRRRYTLNPVVCASSENAPLIFAAGADPSYLFGGLTVGPGSAPSDCGHLDLYFGRLADANGGFLALDAAELVQQPAAWRLLAQALNTRQLDHRVFSTECRNRGLVASPLPLDVRVVLIGDAETYRALYLHDGRFAELFDFIVDFDTCCERDLQGSLLYRELLRCLQHDESLPEIKAPALAVLIEQGARLAARRNKLTLRLEPIFDIAREAGTIARAADRQSIDAEDVQNAIAHREFRHSLPRRDYFRRIGEETIRVRLQGKSIGQINGLTIKPALPEGFGIPLRVSCSFEPGHSADIEIGGRGRPRSLPIDSSSALAAVAGEPPAAYRMEGLLRALLGVMLPLPHPLQFHAILLFESDHPGNDAEHCTAACAAALLSATAGVALRQNLALAGSLDFAGQLQPVPDINERIEGFYDCVLALESGGVHGVIMPKANRGDLMLRSDIVRACTNGSFQIYAVDTLHRALELLTEIPTGVQIDGRFPPGSLLAAAAQRLFRNWQQKTTPDAAAPPVEPARRKA